MVGSRYDDFRTHAHSSDRTGHILNWPFVIFCLVLWTFAVYKLGQSMQDAKLFLKIDQLEREIARLKK